ncbi:efflux transporter outer membrane subunit [Chitiniphilus eburneus]|nr:efflux transporter outer membrane subunit [Chitiniphilus eburneus]
MFMRSLSPGYGVALAALLAGCAVGPDFRSPAPPATGRYTEASLPDATGEAEGVSQRFFQQQALPQQWWTLFGSSRLDALVAQALAASPTLDEAQARLDQAAAAYAAQAGTLWPQVDANLAATREKINTPAPGDPPLRNFGPFTLYHASIDVSYTLDLFGGERRALESLAARTDYQRYQLEAARLALAGNVTVSVIREAALADRIALTEALLAAQRQQLDITSQQERQGGVSRQDLLGQRTLVMQTEALLPPLRQQHAALRHQLAVYLGHAPGDGLPPLPRLDELRLPTQLPWRVPAELARRRPDIRAAEALLAGATAEVGVATANLYPRLTLSGSLGTDQLESSRLLESFNAWKLGAGLVQPLFHGGALRAQKRGAEAALRAAEATYRQTVLTGLQQVADALHALHMDASLLHARANAADDAVAYRDIATRRLALGGISRLSVLDAERQTLQTALDAQAARADRYADTAALLQALGGGWIDTDIAPAASAAR